MKEKPQINAPGIASVLKKLTTPMVEMHMD